MRQLRGYEAAACDWLARRQAGRLAIEAFTQAMRELGIAEHPGGECPAPDCSCVALGDQVEARAIEIVGQKLGRPLPEVPA